MVFGAGVFTMLMIKDDFLLRHYDSGDCQGKLGHSRASVIWHRAQVPISQRWSWSRAGDRYCKLMLTGDRDICWIWDPSCPRLPRPSCCRALYHLLQVQVKSISTSLFGLCTNLFLFLFRQANFQQQFKIYKLVRHRNQLLYSVKLIWVCWKLVKHGKTLLILPLSFQKVWFVRWHCWVQGFCQVEVDLRERL